MVLTPGFRQVVCITRPPFAIEWFRSIEVVRTGHVAGVSRSEEIAQTRVGTGHRVELARLRLMPEAPILLIAQLFRIPDALRSGRHGAARRLEPW